MKTIHNILTKIFLILALGAGWGSSAWAERLTPTFESSYDAGGHWYNITYWTSGSYYAAQGDGENLTYGSGYALSDKGLWQLVGSQSNFVLVTKSGLYAKWDGAKYVGTSTASEATSFSLIDMQGGRDDYWGIHRNDAGAGQVWNPQTQVKEYNNDDNNSSVKFVEPKLKTSSAPVGDAWAANTHWYTMRNVRAASRGVGYIAADGDYIDADGNLKINVATEPDGKGAQWAFVPTGDGSYYIYNRAKGTGYVMGTTNDQNDSNTRTKMYEMTDATANVTKTYTLGTNGDGFWICLTGTNKHLDDSKNTYLTVWDNASGPKNSEGNRFIIEEVADTSIDIDCTFDPAAGTVSDLSTISVSPTDGETPLMTPAEYNDYNSSNPLFTPLPIVLPRLTKDGAEDIVAESIDSENGTHVIRFSSLISNGDYTLVLPQGTFYTLDSEVNVIPVSEMTVNYSLEKSATEGYRVVINGDNGYTVTTTAAVKSGGQSAHHDGFLDLVAAPATNDLRSLSIDCTDKFVWGPVVDNVNKTITYDIRDLTSSLTAGRWYQVQILDRRGKYNGNNWSDNFYETLNSQNTITKKSNTLYVMNYPSMTMNTYASEISGVPIPERDTYWSYVFIADVDASNNIAWQRPNGNYFTGRGENNGTALARNWALSANADNSFSWNGGIMPWNNLGDNGYKHLALGYTGTGTQTGTFQTYFHPVKSGEDYAIYKVILEDGDVAIYTGTANAFIANGGKLELTEKTINSGNYIFLPKGTMPQLSDFTFSEVGEHSMVEDKSSDIWTLNMTLAPTEYPLTPDTEYTLTPANGTKVAESLSEVTVTFSLADGQSVRSAKEKNGHFESSEIPYLIPTSTLSNHRAPRKAAPAGAIMAYSVNKTDEGVYTITFNPTVNASDYYTLVIPKGAFLITTNGEELPNSEQTALYSIGGSPYEWVTIKNHRKANAYFSLSSAGLEANEQMKWGVSSPNGASDYWAFVGDDATGYHIINKAYGPNYVFGIESTSTGSRARMFHISEADAQLTRFDKVASNTTNEFCIMMHSNHGIALHDYSSELKVWSHSEGGHKGDVGSAFVITPVEDAALAACPPYNVYKVVIEGAEASATAAYTGDAVNLLGLSTIQNGRYIALKAASGVPEVGNFTVTPALPNPLMDSFSETAATPATLMLYTDAGTMGTNVTLNFVDSHGHPLTEGTVLYKYLGRPVVELSPEINSYNFGGDAYHSSFFTAGAGYTYGGSTFDNVNQTLTFTLAEIVPEWYTMKPNNGGYISSDYANADGRMHVNSGNAKPTNYAGIWTFKDVQGVDGQNLINAKYYNSRVLSVTGTDGSAVAMMDPVGEIRNDARYKFEIASNGFVQVQGESLFLGNHSMNLVVRGNTSDGSLNLNLTRVPNLGKAVTIVVKDAEDNVLPVGNVVYRSQREDIPTITALLKNGDVYNFGNVPFLTSLFDDSAVSSILDCSYDEEHATLTFVVEQIPAAEWTVVIGGDDNYEVAYNSIVSAHNGEQIILPVDLKAKALTVNAPADKFIWGPVINKTAKTITFDIRDKATEFHTGLYQLMLKGEANITKANNLISKFDENINTASNYLYLAPSIHKEDGAVFKYTGVPTYAEEPTTYLYIMDNGNGTVNISAAGGAELTNLAYTFDAANGEITFTGYGIKGYTDTDGNSDAKVYEPREMPSFVSGTGPTTYALTPISLEDYDSYTLVFAGDFTASTRVKYTKPTPTGATLYANNNMFVVNKNYTAFQPIDFMPTDARCTAVDIERAPEGDVLGKLRLTLSVPVTEWNVAITGAAATDADRVIYKDAEYATGTMVPISGMTLDLTTIKTNVTDRFVWGPIVNEDTRTISFDIRPLATDIVDGWYQIQLLDDSKIADANYRISHNAGNINTAASYIYVLPMYNNTNAVLGKFGGVPTYAGEASSYFHITRDGGSIRIQSPDGRYARNDGALEYGQTASASISNWRFSGNYFQVNKWTAPSLWQNPGNSTAIGGNAGNQGPIVATGSTYHEDHYITRVDPTTLYDVYQVDLTGTSETKVRYTGVNNNGNSFVYNNGYFFVTKGDAAPTKDQFRFDGKMKTIQSINIDANKVITFTVSSVSDGYTNTIIHRQHDVYDRIEAVSNDLLPTGNNHIKRGGGMVPQPNVKDIAETVTVPNPNFNSELPVDAVTNPETITRTYYANDRTMQNTSVFHITQYTKPGSYTECVLPFTRGKGTGGHVAWYQRWYDYETERCLDDAIITLSNNSCALGNYYKFTNGHCNFGSDNNDNIDRRYDPLGKADLKLPAGKDEIYVAVDASEYKDLNTSLGNRNMLEPSLNMRVIYHIVSAHEMAKQLTTTGDTWYESLELIVPNVKRGSDTHKNNAELIPLNMPWTNYWIYKTAGTVGTPQADTQLMPLVAENGDYNTLRSNIQIDIEGTATDGRPMKDYLEVGVFDGNPGNIGSAPYINSNHHLYYKIKGSGVTRVVPEGSQAVIKVYAKYGSQGDASPKYQLFKFTLDFQADCDPLPITDVIGNPLSKRSVDYFESMEYEEVASLTFKQKHVAFAQLPKSLNHNNESSTYAFPIDFERTSYGYSPNFTFANYMITQTGYGIKYQPVELYNRNIKDPTTTSMVIRDDNFFYIDAAETPGQVAKVEFDGNLCAGSRLYCYGWLGNGNHYDSGMQPTGASVVLSLIGVKETIVDGVKHEDRTTIISYLPGTFSDVSYDSQGNTMRSLSYARTPSMELGEYSGSNNLRLDARQVGVWNSIGFSFAIGEISYDRYEMQIINNCFSTTGGDYSLDDFRVFVAPAKPHVEFVAGLCSGAVPHLKVRVPRTAVHDTHVSGGKQKVSYCFVDSEKYLSKLDELGDYSVDSYNAAFNYALMGNGTDADVVDSHGEVLSYRSFWNEQAAYDDDVYETYKEYDFAKIFSGTDGYSPNGIYRQTVGATEEIVYCHELGKVAGWEDSHEYMIAFTQGHVTDDYETAGCSKYNVAAPSCQTTHSFITRPSLTINSDIEEVTLAPPTVCENQIPTINLTMHGHGTEGKEEKLERQMYDWWVGYGMDTEKGYVEKADLHNYYQQKWHDSESGNDIYLCDAIEHFRAHYPDVLTIEGCESKSGYVEGYGDVTFSQADKNCVIHFLHPNQDARVPLLIGQRSMSLPMNDRDAITEDGKRVIYCTAIPIRPHIRFDATTETLFCPDPQEMRFILDKVSPKMISGFTKLHDLYPASMDVVTARMGLRQLDAVRLDAKGNMGHYHLRIPVRGIDVSHKNHPTIKIGKYKKKKGATLTDVAPIIDHVFLTSTDDPAYADRCEVSVAPNGDTEYLPVGRVDLYNAPYSDISSSAKSATEAHIEVGFMRDFHPREGFTYELKAVFEEDASAFPELYQPCEGQVKFKLKIIPEYIQWTGAADNAEWSNDGNWARADRSVLLAENKDSNGGEAARYNSYAANTSNYAGDHRYQSGEVTTGHVFTPMYFTNVLLHDPNLPAPVLKAPTTMPDPNNNFLEWGGETDATEFIKYDMLATPITQEGSFVSGGTVMDPLDLDKRFGVYNKNFGFEPFWPNVCDGLTFEPGTAMYDAQYLEYNKAWVEYELQMNRWYTLASPLQETYAGEWYSPEKTGRQLTPHFCDITYNTTLNDRFNPAYYQRSWDKAGAAWIYRMAGDDGAYIGFEHDTQKADYVRVQKPTYLNWSYVYNDVTVPYSNGGFSVNVRYTDATKAPEKDIKAPEKDIKALVRMPKDDASYLYYQSEASAAVGNTNGQNPDGSNTDAGVARPNGVASGDYTKITRGVGHHRLMSDMLGTTGFVQTIKNASPSNPYYLVGNPLMAPLDMEKFFEENSQFVDHNGDGLKYWIMSDGLQEVSMKVNGNWISTNGSNGVVAPLQGFFVRVASDDEGKATATFPDGMQVKYTADMQKRDVAHPTLKARRHSDAEPGIFRIDATNDGQMQSAAIVYFHDKASAHYDAREDAEILLDGNIASKVSTVFTSAPSTGSGQDQQALQINTMPAGVTMIPVGVIAPKDDTRTTLRFSGIDALEAAMAETPHLYDAAEGTLQVLDEGTTVSVTGTTAGRYFIVSGTTLPVIDDNDDDNDDYDGRIYDLRGIRVNSVQHGTVTISRSRKEYNK